MDKNKIPEHKYVSYYWLKVRNFNDAEWERFKKDLSEFQSLFTYDGIDEEERDICFKFCVSAPKDESQIEKCKKLNEYYKEAFIKEVKKNLHGRVYFNIKRQELKKIV